MCENRYNPRSLPGRVCYLQLLELQNLRSLSSCDLEDQLLVSAEALSLALANSMHGWYLRIITLV